MVKRIEYLDIYKGFAILLILIHHVFQYFPIMAGITDYITDFHVACFYVASGWLRFLTMEKNVDISYEQFFVKKVRRLLVPYITFALISAGLKIGVLAMTHSLTTPIVCDEFYQVLTIGNGPIWFLYRLFFIELIAEYTLRVLVLSHRYVMLSVIIVLGVIAVVLLQGYNAYMLETVRSVLCGCGELFVGYTLASVFYSSKTIQANAILIGGGGVLIGSLISILTNVKVDFKYGSYSEGFVFVLISLLLPLGYLLFIYGCTQWPQQVSNNHSHSYSTIRKAVTFFGENSLTILCVHPTLLLFFSYPFAGKVLHLGAEVQMLIALAVLLYLILAEVPFIYIINRHLSFLIGKSMPIAEVQKEGN